MHTVYASHDKAHDRQPEMMPLVLILVQLLSVWSVETDGQLTCEPATGSHNSLCACSLSDGTGVVDLSAYANPDTTYR